MHALSAAITFALTLTPLLCQRPTPTFEWQKRATILEYGAVPVGKHGISELPVGQSWRMGMNEASSWQLTMPILAGDELLAPGTYRVQLQRTGETTCAILVNGSGQALGGTSDGKVPGQLGKASKPTKKLNIDWQKNGTPAQGNQPAKLVLQFGEVEWQGEVTIVGNKTVPLPGWKLSVFSVPAARLEGRDKAPVPCAALTRGKDEGWNLVVSGKEAKLVPWMAKPTEQNGFGAIVPPNEALTTSGTAEAIEIKIEKPFEVAEHMSSSLTKGTFTVQIGFGKEAVVVTVPEPKANKGGK